MSIETRTDDLERLLGVLPRPLRERLRRLPSTDLLEVVLDLGRPPQARLTGGPHALDDAPVTRETLARVCEAVGRFTADNRAGIEGTLHRIAAIRNRTGETVGLTLRVGRAVYGTIAPLHDLAADAYSILLLGPPGVGKTTRLREMARVLADDFARRVVIVDTSNEIAGDGDIPHPAIGSARRMQVPHPDAQHAVMIEAVENHMPEVIVVDEIGTAAEAAAARTIAERGVQLIGTAHGTTLENLTRNPTLADLVGGVRTVTLSDEGARARGTQKTVSERAGPPTFGAVVEIVDRERLIVHRDTARAVDALLRGIAPRGEPRGTTGESGGEPAIPAPPAPPVPEPEPQRVPAPTKPTPQSGSERMVRIYCYALSRDSTERVLRDLRLNARTVEQAERADLVLALRARSQDRRLQELIAETGAPVYAIKRNSTAQIRRLLRDVFNVVPGLNDATVDAAAREAEAAAQRVIDEGIAVELTPRSAPLRKLQHRIAMRHRLLAQSTGCEPDKHLVIQPGTDSPAPG
ncbi:R3H domain-containing nucleic acid-binding protein [Arhodomonas sp. AD133]|uniref:R3H domain-containing nucleic acid-binding protein n=1 Tax=Arhodomonas sp. AD133 TaxID=3415009 RepID=UPI003EBE7971